MKRIKFIFMFGIIIGLFFVGSNVLKGNIISIDKKDVKEYNGVECIIDVRGIFLNTDEDYNLLDNSRFKLSTWDDKYSFYSQSPQKGVYIIEGYKELTVNNMLSLLTPDEKNLIESIQTPEDIANYYFSMYGIQDDNFCYTDNNVEICSLGLLKQMKLEQTKVAEGYVKQKYTIPASIQLEYINNNGTLSLDSIVLVTDLGPGGFILLKYGDYTDLIKSIVDEDAFYDFLEENMIDYGNYCEYLDSNGRDKLPDQVTNQFKATQSSSIFKIQQATPGSCPPLVMNKRGTVDLSINTTVNEKESISTTSNSKLSYKINIKNNGITTYDNTVVSKLPEEFIYVDGTATHGGIYNANTHTITWTLQRIDEGDSVILTYEAYAPSGISNLKSYISETTLETPAIQNKVISNKATVRLMANPKTNAPLYGIGITLLITWGVALYLYLDNKRKLIKN